MSALSNQFKNFNLYVDGRGYAGNIEEVQLPSLTIVTEDVRTGGLDAPVAIDMGMEKLEATFKISQFDRNLITKWGVSVGGRIPLVMKGALESLDSKVTPVVVRMVGNIDSMEMDTITAGGKVAMSFKFSAISYQFIQDGETLINIDVLNMKREIGGVDRLAKMRKAIGL